MPHMEQPTNLNDTNATSLNPFDTNNKSALMSFGPSVPDDLCIRTATLTSEDYDDFRALALRAPLMLAGFGITTSGTPTPSGADYKRNVPYYKVGPLNVRWDDARKTWEAGQSGGTLIKATAVSSSGAKVEANYAGVANSGDIVPVDSWLGGPMCSGNKLLLTKDDTKYYVVNIQYSALRVLTELDCDTEQTTKCSRVIYLPSAYGNEECSEL